MAGEAYTKTLWVGLALVHFYLASHNDGNSSFLLLYFTLSVLALVCFATPIQDNEVAAKTIFGPYPATVRVNEFHRGRGAAKCAEDRQEVNHHSSSFMFGGTMLQAPLDRDAREAATALALANWLTNETSILVRGDTKESFVEDLWSGVVFCRLCEKFDSATTAGRFSDPPSNEFQRLENFDLVGRRMKHMQLSSQPPNAKAKNALASFLPCLLEFAVLSRNQSSALEQDSLVTDEIVVAHQQQPITEEGEDKDQGRSHPFGYLEMMERLEFMQRPC
ncbi:hypothetical protein BASA81_007148 [Batrachochytrium salamandrivorans]|nr:hypothetical protein BASA81_007148 [Batrachochytrium salamandrivorans]